MRSLSLGVVAFVLAACGGGSGDEGLAQSVPMSQVDATIAAQQPDKKHADPIIWNQTRTVPQGAMQ